jgi:SAM-dependent methyltransferase
MAHAHAGASPHWEKGWVEGIAKGSRFDTAGISLPLKAELARRNHAPRAGMRALVPGCGRAYDALALAEHGFESVVAIDLSPAACEEAKLEIKSAAKADRLDVRCGDFFALDPGAGTYDLIWDNTFLCALEPQVREKWAAQMKALIAPGGAYALA